MASTLLERTRESHEEIERLERAICADFRNEAVTHKERLAQNHRVRSMLDDMANKSKRLVRTSQTNPRGETPIATPRRRAVRCSLSATPLETPGRSGPPSGEVQASVRLRKRDRSCWSGASSGMPTGHAVAGRRPVCAMPKLGFCVEK